MIKQNIRIIFFILLLVLIVLNHLYIDQFRTSADVPIITEGKEANENKDNYKARFMHCSRYTQLEKYIDFENRELIEESKRKGIWTVIDRKTNYNSELQFYCEENVTIDNKKIIITSKNMSEYISKDPSTDTYINNKGYTSGMIESTNAFLYGYFEFEIEVSSGNGIFPAIWMLPYENKALPEIDIFEMLGNNTEIFYGVIHYPNQNGEQCRDYFEQHVESKKSYKVALKWTDKQLTWYIDDAEVYKTNNYIPDEYMYIIINQAVGGTWPGSPDESTIFPNTFIVKNYVINPMRQKER